jgi:ribosomal protein S18 acetylase RimI-like enzyme
MLYVDASNVKAVKLYIDLGFTLNHIDRAYTGDIAPYNGDTPPVSPN